MTFSDAEEDQPSIMQNRNEDSALNRGVEESRGANSSEESPNASQAASTNESGSECVSDASLNKEEPPSHSNSNAHATESSTVSSATSPTLPVASNNGNSSSSAVDTREGEENDLAAAELSESSQFNLDSSLGENNVKGLGNEKVLEKLQQIHGYIQQTAAAMQALENEGDLNKIGQYNTLVKCMRDLKKSESKLTSHLNKARERSSEPRPDQGTSGSESLGVVGDLNGSAGPPSMQDRLARHENEQQQLSERLRESLVRREELMTRYHATRERLNNLKRQRLGLVQEERRLLQSVGAPENLYEDPVPGAESWTTLQLENAIQDFLGLREKVNKLFEAYSAKLQAVDESDTESRDDLRRKIDQITNKKTQIERALTQMSNILQTKREGEAERTNENNEEPSEVVAGDSSAPAENVEETNPEISDRNDREPSEDALETQDGIESSMEGAIGMSAEARELISKQQHLQSLKDQLMNMKKLLQVSQSAVPPRNEDKPDDGESSTRERDSLLGEERRHEDRLGEEEYSQEMEEGRGNPLIESTIIGVNGEVIHLSETERRNPQVVSKYRQLSEAKRRLAKMEEIMTIIAEAKKNGKALTEVLSPENLAILNEAREEENLASRRGESPESAREERDVRTQAAGAPPTNLNELYRNEGGASSASEPTPHSIKMNPVNRVHHHHHHQKQSNGKNEWRTEREISAMQSHFHKNTSGIPSINEGFKFEREKGAIKKQTRELLKDKGNDPRLLEVFALQEELKEKKNALEALMRRMGKSSSFMLDNISDNISENVSDLNSETMEKPSASWGITHHPQNRYYSDHAPSDEEGPLNANEEFAMRYDAPPQQHLSFNTKNRNRCPQKHQRPTDHSQFSANNLSSGSLPKSVRPKNRYHTRATPGSSWENVASSNNAGNQNLTTSKVQNTVAAALSQLSQVQETINSLYGDLRNAELSARQQEMPLLNQFGAGSFPPQTSLNVLPQSLMPSFCLSPLPNSQGRGDLGASNHILAGLQQCFSQLYLHSLEIQSLSKHLQIIDQREKSTTPSHLKEPQRSRSVERGERLDQQQLQHQPHHLARRTNNNADQEFPGRLNPNYQTLSNHRYEDRKASAAPIFGGNVEYVNPSSNDGYQRDAVNNNPVHASLFNVEPQSWQGGEVQEDMNLFENKNLFHPFEHSASDEQLQHPNVDIVLDSSSHFPVDGDDVNEEIPWGTVPSPQIQQQSSDILNNQVLPGTRANNYWDNFRSYSRQNPLSSTAKCNTGEHSHSGSSTPGRRQSSLVNGQLQGSMTYENKARSMNLPCAHNSINKASDKNSSTSRSQNKAGARTRHYAQPSTARKIYAPNSSYHCNAHGDANFGQENLSTSHKRNNRHAYEWLERGGAGADNPLELSENQECGSNVEVVRTNTTCNSSTPRRYSRERDANAPPRNCEENFSSHKVKSRIRANGPSQPANVINTSDTFSEVVREAECLMEKHSEQPQFLLQLFHHAAKITSNSDQQVALELLKELSYQRHQNNIQHNRWTSNSSVTQSDNLSLPTRRRDPNYRNIERITNKNSRSDAACLSGSEDASESIITSDEEESKGIFQMMKNLTPTSSSAGAYPPVRASPQVFSDPSNNPSLTELSPIHATNTLPHNQQLQSESLKGLLPKDIFNIFAPGTKECRKSENQGNSSTLQRKRQEIGSSFGNYGQSSSLYESSSTHSSSTVTPSSKSNPKPAADVMYQKLFTSNVDKHNNKKQSRKSSRRNLVKETEEEESSNWDPRNKKENLNPKLISVASNDVLQEPVSGFEALVSASLREVLLCFENADYSQVSTSQVLESLHHSIMRQVQFHSSSLGFSSNFVCSIDSQLKTALHNFDGNILPAVRKDIAAAVTQVLIQEYCSLFMQHDNHLPETSPHAFQQQPNNLSDPANKLELDPHKRVAQFHKQSSCNSLFGSQESGSKENRPTWSFNPIIPAEYSQNTRASLFSNPNMNPRSREEDLKRDFGAANYKSKGAISKNIVSQVGGGAQNIHREEPHNGKGAAPTGSTRESPFPEVSSFPESWIVQRGNLNQSGVEGVVYPFSESPFGREREDADYAGRQENALKLEPNDTEADQEHARNKDFMNVSLPVHDLAEADQSQDPVEADGVESSSLENFQFEAAASSNFQEAKEFSLKFAPKKKKKAIPEQGLDEVPTRLLNGIDRNTPPLVSGRNADDANPEGVIHPHRCSHFPPQSSPTQQHQAPNCNNGDQNGSNPNTESSSGVGG